MWLLVAVVYAAMGIPIAFFLVLSIISGSTETETTDAARMVVRSLIALLRLCWRRRMQALQAWWRHV